MLHSSSSKKGASIMLNRFASEKCIIWFFLGMFCFSNSGKYVEIQSHWIPLQVVSYYRVWSTYTKVRHLYKKSL